MSYNCFESAVIPCTLFEDAITWPKSDILILDVCFTDEFTTSLRYFDCMHLCNIARYVSNKYNLSVKSASFSNLLDSICTAGLIHYLGRKISHLSYLHPDLFEDAPLSFSFSCVHLLSNSRYFGCAGTIYNSFGTS